MTTIQSHGPTTTTSNNCTGRLLPLLRTPKQKLTRQQRSLDVECECPTVLLYRFVPAPLVFSLTTTTSSCLKHCDQWVKTTACRRPIISVHRFTFTKISFEVELQDSCCLNSHGAMEIRRKIKKCRHDSSRTLIEKKAEISSHDCNGPCLAKKRRTIDCYVELRGPISSHDRNGLCVSKRFRVILHTAAAKKCFTIECITLYQIVVVSHWLTHIRCLPDHQKRM